MFAGVGDERRAGALGRDEVAVEPGLDIKWAVRIEHPAQPLTDRPRLRQRLPALRDRGRAAPSSSVRVHERLFLDTPGDVFTSVLQFWRSDRDSRY